MPHMVSVEMRFRARKVNLREKLWQVARSEVLPGKREVDVLSRAEPLTARPRRPGGQ